MSPTPLGLSRICLTFSFLPSPPSKCGSCPFILHSGLISKISFSVVHFDHFANHPPYPERYFMNLSLAGTQQWVQRDLVSLTACPLLELHQVLPGRRGTFSYWCKRTSGLGVPRLRSHYSTVFCPALSCNWLPDPSYVPNWFMGWEMTMGNQVHADTLIYPVGICVMTCRRISEMGTWKPCKHTTGISVGSIVHREWLSHFSICHISIEIIVNNMHLWIFIRIIVYNKRYASLL